MDFPAFLKDMPCIILSDENIPPGFYDQDGNCIIKVPFGLTRPDGVIANYPSYTCDNHGCRLKDK
jgi:hypothetical protein